uniref:EF-hand domain-containing protein n=1 Tax=Panagrolaimus sp. ES5 TaxID=591445 RepID=A0AC34FWL3_9BILA
MDSEVYRKAFMVFDVNNDGQITIDELKKVMNNCGIFPSNLELCFAMNQGDIDHDGVISYEEFMEFMLKRNNPARKYTNHELYQQFEFFDKDKDGCIDCNEMILLVNELHINQNFPQMLIEKLFNKADKNHDKKISFEEFVTAVN